MRVLRLLSVMMVFALVSGCGGGPVTDDITGYDVMADLLPGQDANSVGELRVETIVSANQAATGQEIQVQCRAAGEGSEDVTTGFTVSGDKNTVEGDKVVFTAPGSYVVTCTISGTDVVDASGETITVTDGPVAKVVASVAEQNVVAGESTTVTCKAYDEFGNQITIDMEIVVPADLTVAGNSVSGTKAGVYDIVCQPVAGTDGVELKGAKMQIVAGPATGLLLSLVPAKTNYRVGNQVKVGYTLVDDFQNPVAGAEITNPTVDPAEGVKGLADPLQFQFEAEGFYTFSACVVDDPGKCDSVEAYCDGTAPLLVIESPERAAMLQGDATVMVTGTVHDDVGGLAELTINGNLVPVKDDNTFAYPMPAKQGLNVIDANATDVFGLKNRSMRSFLFSNQYYPAVPEDTKLSLIPNAARAYLDDKLLDNDADPSDTATVAAIAEEVVSKLDLIKMLPNPLLEKRVWPCDYIVFLKSITFDRPTVNAYFYEGGIAIDVVIPNFAGVGRVEGDGTLCVKDDFSMSAKKLNIKIGINIGVDAETHMLNISSRGTQVDFEDLDINIGWTVDWLLGMLNNTITNVLKGVINDQVDGIINDLEADANEAIAEPIEIPIEGFIPGMADMLLKVTIQPERTDWKPEGGQLDISLAVTADKRVARDYIPGSIGRNACLSGKPEVFTFDVQDPFKINAAVMNDLVSQAAFALWYNGGLKIDLTAEAAAEMGLDLSEYGFADLVAHVNALLPPIVQTCGEENLVVQLGDAYLELTTSNFLGRPLDMHAFLFAELEAEITAEDNEDGTQTLMIQILPPRRLDLDIEEINPEWLGEEQTLIDMITGLIPGLIKDPFDIDIPSFNLAELGGEDIALPNMDLFIVIEQIEQIIGHTVLGANLKLQAAADEPTEPVAQ